jgi:vacuolar protein sorting-associated protein VTA1
MAAATFLELSHIWGPLDPDIASKIKYAKYHALRIAKAFKAGEDPNASNPVTELPSEEQKPLDPNDPEVRAINGQSRTEHTQASLQPSVEEVPDEHEQLAPRLARDSSLNQSLHPSRAPSLPRSPSQNRASGSVGGLPTQNPAAEDYYTSPAHPDPITSVPSADADTGYFPQVPEDHKMPDQPSLPMAPSEFPTYSSGPELPTAPVLPPPPATYPESSVPDIPRPFAHYPNQAPTHIPHQNAPTPAVPQNTQQLGLPQSNSTLTSAQAAYRTDDQSILKAQKHARWAISALNFEDVNTAVKELMGALESLGAA